MNLRNNSQGWPLTSALIHSDAHQENYIACIYGTIGASEDTEIFKTVSDMKSSSFKKGTDVYRQLCSVLIPLAYCDKNTLTKSNLGETRSILAHNFRLQFIISEKLIQELEAPSHIHSQEHKCMHAYAQFVFSTVTKSSCVS